MEALCQLRSVAHNTLVELLRAQAVTRKPKLLPPLPKTQNTAPFARQSGLFPAVLCKGSGVLPTVVGSEALSPSLPKRSWVGSMRYRDDGGTRGADMGAEVQRPPGAQLLTVLLGALGAGPLLLYGLSATSDRIITDLGITEAQFGLLATVCFACAAMGNGLLGRLADRHSDMALMLSIYVVSAMALLLAGVPGSYVLLLIAAALSGLAQSFSNGVTNRIIVERVPPQKRIAWVGVKQSGVQIAQLVSSIGFPVLALLVGWRGAALATAFIPLALIVLTWRTLRTVPRLSDSKASADTSSTRTRPASIPSRARHPRMLWALAAFGLFNGVGMQATNVYMPLFAVRELGFSLVLGGITAAVAGVVGVAARVGWARVMARGASGPALMLILALTALTASTAFLSALLSGSAALLWAAVVLHGASALGVSVVLMSSLLRFIPPESMASASGAVTAGMFIGFALGPVGMGLLISLPGGFLVGWAAVCGTYLVCGAVAVALLLRAKGPRRDN